MEDVTLQELRSSPRYRVDLEARVSTPCVNSMQHPVRLVNLSKSGLQLECDPRLMQALMPKAEADRTRRHQVCMTISLTLPNQAPAEVMSIEAELIYSRRLAQSRFLIGCAFTGMEEGDAESLAAFLAQHGEPC